VSVGLIAAAARGCEFSRLYCVPAVSMPPAPAAELRTFASTASAHHSKLQLSN